MIRDPSDGTVKQPEKPLLETKISGLPEGSGKDSQRMEASRKWLKEFQEKKMREESLSIAQMLLGESNHG